jgi:hypothetical protein
MPVPGARDAYHPLDSKGDHAMGETVGGNGAAIGRLHQQIQRLMDADLILLEDGEWLMATLDGILQRLTAADVRASQSEMRGFIERLQDLIQTGIIEAAAGQPPVAAARMILVSLRGHEELVMECDAG